MWNSTHFRFSPPVTVDFGGCRRLGKVMKYNHHTLWVKIMLGASTYTIVKRHKKKHNCAWRW